VDELRQRAERVLPGGVSSPVRAYHAVPGEPPDLVRGEGARVYDRAGRGYIDFVLAYGPLILGHSAAPVLAAVREQVARGLAYGHTAAVEVGLAERIVELVPSVEMVRFVSSGTEAVMSAVRLARAATGRDIVVKFAGAYHGHADALLVDAGSGVETLAIPGSPGVPRAAVQHTRVLAYNDPGAVAALFGAEGEQIAAVLVEPVAGNMGCVAPVAGFLEQLRSLTLASGALLIFDEVMTGFRVALGGAQELYGVRPDLTCLGKVIGGGLPVGAYGGSRHLMEQVAPSGPVYQAGTLSGSPPAMAAGCAVLDALRDGGAYAVLERVTSHMAAGLSSAAATAGIPCAVNRVGSMITPFLGVDTVTDLRGARCADRRWFATTHGAWRAGGVLWPPSQFETGFVSSAHVEADADRAVEVFAAALRGLPAAAAGLASGRC
jgi:glutamate-1-semialdehyde 2,1-aminomutase